MEYARLVSLVPGGHGSLTLCPEGSSQNPRPHLPGKISDISNRVNIPTFQSGQQTYEHSEITIKLQSKSSPFFLCLHKLQILKTPAMLIKESETVQLRICKNSIVLPFSVLGPCSGLSDTRVNGNPGEGTSYSPSTLRLPWWLRIVRICL